MNTKLSPLYSSESEMKEALRLKKVWKLLIVSYLFASYLWYGIGSIESLPGLFIADPVMKHVVNLGMYLFTCGPAILIGSLFFNHLLKEVLREYLA